MSFQNKKEEDLLQIHIDNLLQMAEMARQIDFFQKEIARLNVETEQLEAELEKREAFKRSKNGALN